MTPFGHLGAGADEAVVLDDHRAGLQRLEHAADAGAAGDVAVLADLRAGADRGPGVDHGAAVDIGAEIDEATASARRPARCRPSGARRSRARRGSRPRGTGPRPSPSNLDGHLVPPDRPAGAAGDQRHVVEAERQQHRLLQPLVDGPAVRPGSATRTSPPVEQVERRLDRVADLAARARSRSGRGPSNAASTIRCSSLMFHAPAL